MLGRELLVDGGGAKGGILADDMGLGKTMQAIACMRGNPLKTLVVTIVGTVSQWRDAMIEFGGYRPVIINPSFRGILPCGVDVAITTYSSFQKAVVPECLASTEWGRVLLDEGHVIRNPGTKVYKEISRLRAEARWVLSGTPIQNSARDLEAIGRWICGGDGIGEGGVDGFVERMVLRRTQEQQASANPRLALPALKTRVVRLEFETEEEAAFYEGVESYYQDKAMTNFEAMEGLTRCRQACTNPALLQADGAGKKGAKRKRVFAAGEGLVGTKLGFLVKDISEFVGVRGKKCLVFCVWTREMRFLQDALKGAGVSSMIYDGQLSRDNKESVLYNFKNTDMSVLIIQINCGSSGLNLQCASRVYITSPNYNPCVELQAIGRAYRKGQTECVTCVRVVMAGTVEERCMEIQEKKLDVIGEAMKDDSMVGRLGCEVDGGATSC